MRTSRTMLRACRAQRGRRTAVEPGRIRIRISTIASTSFKQLERALVAYFVEHVDGLAPRRRLLVADAFNRGLDPFKLRRLLGHLYGIRVHPHIDRPYPSHGTDALVEACDQMGAFVILVAFCKSIEFGRKALHFFQLPLVGTELAPRIKGRQHAVERLLNLYNRNTELTGQTPQTRAGLPGRKNLLVPLIWD